MTQATTDSPRCACCGGVWHPATGHMVGHPTEVHVCGRCMGTEIVPLIKESMEREIRVSTPLKREAVARRRAGDRRAQVPRVNFCDHAATSVGAARRGA